MTKINNYEELLLEKKRLKRNLHLLKLEADDEVQVIKERLAPVMRIVKLLNVFKKKEPTADGEPPKTTAGSLLKMGAEAGIDMFVTRKLAGVSWIAKMAVPFVLRGLSSTLLNKFRKPRTA